jgi:hypothetical protein
MPKPEYTKHTSVFMKPAHRLVLHATYRNFFSPTGPVMARPGEKVDAPAIEVFSDLPMRERTVAGGVPQEVNFRSWDTKDGKVCNWEIVYADGSYHGGLDSTLNYYDRKRARMERGGEVMVGSFTYGVLDGKNCIYSGEGFRLQGTYQHGSVVKIESLVMEEEGSCPEFMVGDETNALELETATILKDDTWKKLKGAIPNKVKFLKAEKVGDSEFWEGTVVYHCGSRFEGRLVSWLPFRGEFKPLILGNIKLEMRYTGSCWPGNKWTGSTSDTLDAEVRAETERGWALLAGGYLYNGGLLGGGCVSMTITKESLSKVHDGPHVPTMKEYIPHPMEFSDFARGGVACTYDCEKRKCLSLLEGNLKMEKSQCKAVLRWGKSTFIGLVDITGYPMFPVEGRLFSFFNDGSFRIVDGKFRHLRGNDGDRWPDVGFGEWRLESTAAQTLIFNKTPLIGPGYLDIRALSMAHQDGVRTTPSLRVTMTRPNEKHTDRVLIHTTGNWRARDCKAIGTMKPKQRALRFPTLMEESRILVIGKIFICGEWKFTNGDRAIGMISDSMDIIRGEFATNRGESLVYGEATSSMEVDAATCARSARIYSVITHNHRDSSLKKYECPMMGCPMLNPYICTKDQVSYDASTSSKLLLSGLCPTGRDDGIMYIYNRTLADMAQCDASSEEPSDVGHAALVLGQDTLRLCKKQKTG